MIHVVIGHICSGKSTYVRERAKDEDVVIDLDRIALALAAEGTTHHDYPDHIKQISRGLRWWAIDDAVRLNRRASWDVWIIHAYPSDEDLARYRRLGAAIKVMEADADTLRARASTERPPAMRQELEHRLAKA